MSSTAVAFVGMIAGATIVMALIQVGAIIFAARFAKRLEGILDRLEREVQPMLQQLTTVSSEAARAAAIVTDQVERVDRTLGLVSTRVDHAVEGAQRALSKPAREGVALAAGLKATVRTLRELRKRRREASGSRADDEDALFIG